MKTANKKRVGIINHWMVNNYGALLLAYGLEKKIADMGYDVESITYLPDEVRRPWKLSIAKKIGFITYLLRLGYFSVFILPRQKGFSHMRRSMNTSKQEYSDSTICEIDKVYDKVVIGGDQLWNTKVNYYNENNFLPFIQDSSKKIVYAASIAQETVRPDIREDFITYARSFSYVTSREKHTQNLIEELAGVPAPRVADPAFLLDAGAWAELAEKDSKAPSKFVFVYQVQSDKVLINFAKNLARQIGAKVIFCPFPLKKQIGCKRKPYISPEQWLWYVQHAEYVVTDAFHGTVFSIIFNTPFFVEISEYGKDTASRITNILEVFGLEERLFSTEKLPVLKDIDYAKVNKIISQERIEAVEHLRQMLDT